MFNAIVLELDVAVLEKETNWFTETLDVEVSQLVCHFATLNKIHNLMK